MAEPIRFWLAPQADAPADPIFGPALAYDLEILQPEATVGDYLQGLCDFQAEHLADCKGCDGCCHERAPLTICDWQLAQPGPETAFEQWLRDWAELGFCGPAIDLTLRRTAAGACRFLDAAAKCCKIHTRRSFTCRSHCCLPKTWRAEQLRGAIINAGEDELVRRLLQLPPEKQPWAERLAECKLDDYAPNAFSALPPEQWAQAVLRDLAGPELWAELYRPTAE